MAAVITILIVMSLLYFVGVPIIVLAWLASDIGAVSRLALARLKARSPRERGLPKPAL